MASLALEEAADDGMNMYENSDFIEKEQPELSEETKELISLYQRDPTEENYFNLREKVIEDYNAVVERKETKLSELKTETAGQAWRRGHRGRNGGPGTGDLYHLLESDQQQYVPLPPTPASWSGRVASAARYDYIPVMGAGGEHLHQAHSGHQRGVRGVCGGYRRDSPLQLGKRDLSGRRAGLPGETSSPMRTPLATAPGSRRRTG